MKCVVYSSCDVIQCDQREDSTYMEDEGFEWPEKEYTCTESSSLTIFETSYTHHAFPTLMIIICFDNLKKHGEKTWP